ncbi:Structural maintenance of chromosomes protein 3 [Blomia tropicalis]|nr:Structural maintenance of chromosomes protein 3 [Blomia tropicalis]
MSMMEIAGNCSPNHSNFIVSQDFINEIGLATPKELLTAAYEMQHDASTVPVCILHPNILFPTVDDCVGIEILANFSNSDKFTKLQSLSSGQKTIISTALVFALQQIDSTPFFVFDKIDANLDKTWRESLSS